MTNRVLGRTCLFPLVYGVCRDTARFYSGDFTMRCRIFGFVFSLFISRSALQLDQVLMAIY